VVTAALVSRLRAAGRAAVAFKPIQTGADGRDEDHLAYARWLGGAPGPPPVYRLPLPASPHLAAALESVTIALEPIRDACEQLGAAGQAVVVEGAGGVLVPLADGLTMLDLMAELGLPVILVSRPGLGTINHTLLSLRELGRAGLEVAGVIVSDAEGRPWSVIEPDNLATIKRLGGVPLLGVLPRFGDETTPAQFEAIVGKALALPEPRPTRTSADLWRRDQAVLWHPFTRHSAQRDGPPFPVITRGQGIWLFDAEGRRYLDAIASWWAANLGHSHPRLTAAIARQAGRLQHSILGNLSHGGAIELAQRLTALLPGGPRRVFYAGDGACANEAALRIAAQHWHNLGQRGRTGFVAFREGYHGDTLGAVAVGYLEDFHRAYRPLLFPVTQLDLPLCAGSPLDPGASVPPAALTEVERVLEARAETLAAVMVEPLCQGAAGMRMYPPSFLSHLAACCRRLGILLIVDEIAMGFGRTGAMFAHQHAAVDPDLVTLGKGLSGGCLPLSAVIVKEEIFASFDDQPEDHTFYYGHTFAGNPLAAAAALANLEVFEQEAIVARTRALGGLLTAQLAPLATLDGVRNVRTLGLIGAFELDRAERAQAVRRRLLANGVLLRPLGATVYLAPPLIIGEAELVELVARVADAVAAQD
jgi:adenosylmethionine-8-amino-7-oxononanoate aminotransferase